MRVAGSGRAATPIALTLALVAPCRRARLAARHVGVPRLARGAALLGMLAFAAPAQAASPQLRALSNRADLISGGDVLVELRGSRLAGARVVAAGRDVSAAFARRADGGVVGLVTGLPLGPSTIVVRLRDGRGARLRVRNHPIEGPVFAGTQVRPWKCLEDECAPQTTYELRYRPDDTRTRSFKSYDPQDPPGDVATTTTDDGRRVPFVVRLEQGTMDRGRYAAAVLWDVAHDRPLWGGKVLWPFGGDCKPWHQQDTPVDPLGSYPLDSGLADHTFGTEQALGSIFGNGNALTALGKGFLVADSSLNKLGSQCNPIVSAEAVMMLKEHLIETYGEIRHTIGAGSSGGSMQQHMIAAGYPGLLDAIQPMASFPDLWSTVTEAQDCHLLNHAFDTNPALWWSQHDQDAVTGSMVGTACRLQWDGPQLGTPDVGNYAAQWLRPDNPRGCGLPDDQIYPAGPVRCTLQDYAPGVFARRADGFAQRPFDNAGVQYGLRALVAGTITPEQFLDVNARVGGIDIDWRFTPRRTLADAEAVRTVYRAGMVSGGAALAATPMIDLRGTDNFDIHADFHSYAMRARLDRDSGGHANQIIWTGARPLVGDPTSFDLAFELLDDWLDAIDADARAVPRAAKVAHARPGAARDACWFEGRRIDDMTRCAALFPYWSDPRLAAGGPATDDVLACTLQPVDPRDYGGRLSDAEIAQLRAIFPDGVCDYSRPPRWYEPVAPWTTFADGPGGRPLGPPPRSQPLARRR